jgi:hypothetical protein
MVSLLRCRQYVWHEMKTWPDRDQHRCNRWRWHRGAHFAPHGHAWEGKR